MGMWYVSVLVVVVVTVASISAWPALKQVKKNKLEEPSGACRKYAYCKGNVFPNRMRVGGWGITCESDDITEDDVMQRCCLPQQRHLVCYGIEVEGDKLNFSNDTANVLTTTDYTDLCEMMVKDAEKTPGSFNSATFLPGGGDVAYRYGNWIEVQQPSERHIHNIACGILDEED